MLRFYIVGGLIICVNNLIKFTKLSFGVVAFKCIKLTFYSHGEVKEGAQVRLFRAGSDLSHMPKNVSECLSIVRLLF